MALRLISCSSLVRLTPQFINGVSRSSLRFIRREPTLLQINRPKWANREAVRKKLPSFRFSMSDEEKAKKLKEIETLRTEQQPKGLVAKLKYYVKRYWYIAIPVHFGCSALWLGTLYLIARSGVDVLSLLETMHIPESVINKVKDTPETAGHIVVALLLYKIATPLRYATTLAGIRVAFIVLQKLGLLRTAKEVTFQVRNQYTELNRRRLSSASLNASITKNVKRSSKPITKGK